jgi:hypothetical protein
VGVERQLQYDLEDSRYGYEDCGLVGCGAVSQCEGVPSILKVLQAFEISGSICSMTCHKILSNNVVRIQPLQLWILT